MIGRFPDKPIPISCLVGFLALFASAFSAITLWASYKAFTKNPPATESGSMLLSWGIIALIPAVIALGFCIFRISTSGKRKQ